jgi:hypothetical protein
MTPWKKPMHSKDVLIDRPVDRGGGAARLVKMSRRKAAPRRTCWTAKELRYLDAWSGSRSIGDMCQRLRRSERAIRCQLSRRGLSAKVHDGWGFRQLRDRLHLRSSAIWRYAIQGILCVHSAQVLLNRQMLLAGCHRALPPIRTMSIGEVARQLRWRHSQVLAAAQAKHCRLINLRFTDASVKQLSECVRVAPTCELLSSGIKRWLFGSDRPQIACGSSTALPLHLSILRRCHGCGRRVRGIAFFWHRLHCTTVMGDANRGDVSCRASMHFIAKCQLG